MPDKLPLLSHAAVKDDQMDTITNIQFDDWEAEQMQGPEFRAEVEKLEPIYQMARDWEVFRQRIIDCWKAITEATVSVFWQITDETYELIVQLRRFQLQYDLVHHWRMSNRFAYWLSDKWPEQWLPELRLE